MGGKALEVRHPALHTIEIMRNIIAVWGDYDFWNADRKNVILQNFRVKRANVYIAHLPVFSFVRPP